jgi:hypothetical protein
VFLGTFFFGRIFPSIKKALENGMLQALPEKNKQFFFMSLLAWPLKKLQA